MNDNLFLILCVGLNIGLMIALWAFFRRLKNRGDRLVLKRERIGGNLLVFLLLCSLILSGGEIRFRYFVDTTDSFGLTKMTRRWFDRHFHINDSGFRDSYPLYHNMMRPGRRRIMFLGDSFTAAHGVPDVEDRFANLIRERLPDTEVHVFAECGWDTGAELDIVRKASEFQYELDIVVLVYCLNDIADISPQWQTVMQSVYEKDRPGFFVESSWLINAMHHRLKAARDPNISKYYDFVHDNYEGDVWEEQQQRLTELNRLVGESNGRLAVVTFPFLHALGDSYAYADVHSRLDEFWSSLGVPHLDLLKTYSGKSPGEIVVNRFDAHPNESSHKMAADAIEPFLQSLLANASRKLSHGQ